MSPKLTKTIIGAVIAIALAAAVSYGLISQQTADQLQTKANQTLQNDQGSPSPGQNQLPTPPSNSIPQAPSQPGSSPQPPAPAPRQ
jgi:methylmalonyl-CoA mutase N-terminal domain/subunit